MEETGFVREALSTRGGTAFTECTLQKSGDSTCILGQDCYSSSLCVKRREIFQLLVFHDVPCHNIVWCTSTSSFHRSLRQGEAIRITYRTRKVKPQLGHGL